MAAAQQEATQTGSSLEISVRGLRSNTIGAHRQCYSGQREQFYQGCTESFSNATMFITFTNSAFVKIPVHSLRYVTDGQHQPAHQLPSPAVLWT